jgi:hypothetical protein
MSRTVMQVPLNRDQAAAVRRMARSKGITDTDLIAEWVSEKLCAS